MKKLIALPLLWASVSVWADCDAQFPSELPLVPAGESATEQQMYEAQQATLAYIEAGKHYLTCKAPITSRAHNRKVRFLERAAANYNRELARFQRDSDLLAVK